MFSHYTPFFSVLFREQRRMTSRRIYLGAAVVLPLFLIFFMSTIFGTGQMVDLPIGVVDGDNTSSSREIIRGIAATPTFDVLHCYADDAAARSALQRKEIYGYLHIPPHFEDNLLRGHGVTLSYYYHYALLAVGGEVMSGFEQALLPVRMAPIVLDAVALGATQERVETFLLPMTSDDHALYNPSLNYATYLTVPIFYIMFQILVLLVTLYAIGSESKEGNGGEWLAMARGNVWVAVLAKLLPYTLLFVAEMMLAGVVFFRFMAIPLLGNAWLLAFAAVLFVLATQALALILYSLFPVHQCGLHGRFAGSHPLGSHFSAHGHVSHRAIYRHALPRASFYGGNAAGSLFRWNGEFLYGCPGCAYPVPSFGSGATPALASLLNSASL